MNIFSELKLLFQAKGVVQDTIKEGTQMQALEKGWKTSEFWFGLILPKVLLLITMAQHVLPPVVWAWATTAIAIAYIFGRCALKIISLVASAHNGDAAAALAEITAQTTVAK